MWVSRFWIVSSVIPFSLSPGLISVQVPALTAAYLIFAMVSIVITRYATGARPSTGSGERMLTG